MVFQNLFIPLIFLIKLANSESNFTSELDAFYIKNHKLIIELQGMKLDSDEKGLFLRATQDIPDKTGYILIPKDWLIFRCKKK